jgi:hypothetical protein
MAGTHAADIPTARRQYASAVTDGSADQLRIMAVSNGNNSHQQSAAANLDSKSHARLRDLLFRRAEPHFYAFDLLWDEHAWSDDEVERRRFRNGEDLRYPISSPEALHVLNRNYN